MGAAGSEYDAQRAFWDALSGSRVADRIGITAGDPRSVDRFDEWFWNYYPYLGDDLVPWSSLRDRDVLEIGLGYGTTLRRLSRCSHRVAGLDIAIGPLRLASATTTDCSLVNGTALSTPFKDGSFDLVIAFGSIHHTGDIDRAIAECQRVLRPGGVLVAMMYYRYSYKRLVLDIATFPLALLNRLRPLRSRIIGWFYDRDTSGRGAPITEFVGRRELRRKLHGFNIEYMRTANVDNPQDLLPLRLQRRWLDRVRLVLLRLPVWRVIGLDLYVRARRR